MDRRAIFVGNWQGVQHDGPSHQKIRSLMDRWKLLFGPEKQYPFSSLTDPTAEPDFLYNPSRSDLARIINDDVLGVTSETLLLFYYVGHSTPEGEGDIRLTLKVDDNGRVASIKLSQLIDSVHDSNISKLVMILDTCHSGRVRNIANNYHGDCYVMVATGAGYAFDADFSDRILRTLEREPHQNDQRIDRKRGGITFEKVFKVSVAQLRNFNKLKNYKQEPVAFGSFGDEVLKKSPSPMTDAYNVFATDRTVYGRTFFILSSLLNNNYSRDELIEALRKEKIFRISSKGTGNYIAKDRIENYLDFLLRARLVVFPHSTVTLTNTGRQAAHQTSYNKILIDCINEYILPEGVSVETISGTIKDLLEDAIQPSPINIKERLQMNGVNMVIDDVVRISFKILALTGAFIKGSADSLFPSESG